MQGRTIGLIAIGLWGFTVVIVGWFFGRDWTTPIGDDRREIALTPAERDLVLGEMRTVLSSVNGVLSGLAEKDRKKVEDSARGAGMKMAAEENAGLIAKLPFEFKEMGLGLHRGFDDLADATKKGETPEQLLGRIAELTSRCNACHNHYRVSGVKTASAEPTSDPAAFAGMLATMEPALPPVVALPAMR